VTVARGPGVPCTPGPHARYGADMRRLLPLVLLLASATACSGGEDADPARAALADTSPTTYTGCDRAACTGELDSGAYEVQLPTSWNGTLLLWSHGYRAASASPPDFAEPDRSAESAPSDEVAELLLAQGYALAGSSYRTNGWAVQDGVQAGEEVYQLFRDSIGQPRRTYVWGASMGGLISQLLSEKHPEWVSGAAPECGAVAGTTENLDGALAIGYLVKTLIDPGLKITEFDSAEESKRMFQRAQKKVTAAASEDTGTVEAIAAIAHLADKTKTYDGHDFPSTVAAHAESIITALGFTTFGQQEFAERVGGQGLDITGLDFSTSADDAALRPLVTGLKGDLDAMYTALAEGERPAVDAAAREQARAQGEPTGVVDHPTVTLHTEDDPLAVVSNERVLGDRIAAADGGVRNLVQLYTKAPQTYDAPAPYGAGHCNFTASEQVGLVTVLDAFVRTGVRPTTRDTNRAFVQPTGLDTTFEATPFALLQG